MDKLEKAIMTIKNLESKISKVQKLLVELKSRRDWKSAKEVDEHINLMLSVSEVK